MAAGAQTRLNEKALYARAEAWRPYRGVAAHLLWAYYHAVKKRDVVPVGAKKVGVKKPAAKPAKNKAPKRKKKNG